MSPDPFHLNGQAVARDLLRVIEERDALAARLAAVEVVLADEPLLLTKIREDMGSGFPNELSERRGRTITGWVDRLRAAVRAAPTEATT